MGRIAYTGKLTQYRSLIITYCMYDMLCTLSFLNTIAKESYGVR